MKDGVVHCDLPPGLEVRHARRRQVQGEGQHPLGQRASTPTRPRCGSTIACSRCRSPGAERDFLARPQSGVEDKRSPRSSSRRCATPKPAESFQFERHGYFVRDQRRRLQPHGHAAGLLAESLTKLGAAVGELLKQRGETLAVAESSAGGLINAALVAVPGAVGLLPRRSDRLYPPGRTALLGITKQETGRSARRASPGRSSSPRACSRTSARPGASPRPARRPDRQRLRRSGRPRLLRRFRPGRGRDHLQDLERRPRSEHVGVRAARAGAAGGLPGGRQEEIMPAKFLFVS